MKEINNYKDFWPFYVREHSDPRNRRIHFLGTALTFLVIVLALLFQNAWLLILMPVCGYAFAWFGHFVVEKNRPATFKYPLWSLISDYKMFFLILTGRMDDEIEKLQQKSRHS